MCGACGRARVDPVSAALAAPYASVVVARLCSAVLGGVGSAGAGVGGVVLGEAGLGGTARRTARVAAGPTGWTCATSSGARACATFPELVQVVAGELARRAVGEGVDPVARVWEVARAAAPHRPVHRPPGTGDAAGAGERSRADGRGGRGTWIHDAVADALAVALPIALARTALSPGERRGEGRGRRGLEPERPRGGD